MKGSTPGPSHADGQPTAARSFPNLRPKDAATLIVLRRDPDGVRVLMGRRSDKHAFMPGRVVFPGGRIERADLRAPSVDDLRPEVAARLAIRTARASPARLRAMALAAIRETFEETGYLIGRPLADPPTPLNPAWSAFLQSGVIPTLQPLSFVARAITPPGQNRRFDARFFATFADAIGGQVEGRDGELEGAAWLTFEEAAHTALPKITQLVIGSLRERLQVDPDLVADHPVPFFVKRHGTHCVDEL